MTTMPAPPVSRRKRRLRLTEWIFLILVVLGLIGVDLMFYFWPFRYREVHPLLESAFSSRVEVKSYHRTYFPHPGFVATGVSLFRRNDTSIPPLATIDSMTVVGTWSGLILHPHTLHALRLAGLHVQIPPAGSRARGTDFSGGVLSSSQQKMDYQLIDAGGAVLEFLRDGQPPLRFSFPKLIVQDLRADRPLSFSMILELPVLRGVVQTDGSLGPLSPSQYETTPLHGNFTLQSADLSQVDGLAGHVHSAGTYSGTLSALNVGGTAAVPDFRVTDAHRVRLDARYAARVNGASGDVQIQHAEIKTGDSVLQASGSIAGSPKTVQVDFSTQNSRVEQLLAIIQTRTPSVAGPVRFSARAEFQPGPEPFLRRLRLDGKLSLDGIQMVDPQTRKDVDDFSARVRRDAPGLPDASHGGDAVQVTADASARTAFHDGTAFFPEVQVSLPGARARLHGTFNLMTTGVHLTGTAKLQRSLSHAKTGWESWLLKPLAPFFRHGNTGTVVSIAVTGTAANPQIRQDILHDK